MILKGSQRGGAAQLARHLLKTIENEHVELYEVRGFVSDDLPGALARSLRDQPGHALPPVPLLPVLEPAPIRARAGRGVRERYRRSRRAPRPEGPAARRHLSREGGPPARALRLVAHRPGQDDGDQPALLQEPSARTLEGDLPRAALADAARPRGQPGDEPAQLQPGRVAAGAARGQGRQGAERHVSGVLGGRELARELPGASRGARLLARRRATGAASSLSISGARSTRSPNGPASKRRTCGSARQRARPARASRRRRRRSRRR
jgi:hypothetical protein